MPGTGHHTGGRSGSRVSLDLHPTVHVASGCYSTGLMPYARLSRSGIVSIGNRAMWQHSRRFQGAEHRSSSLTHRQQVFTVRQRLRLDSLARAFAPFVVELFAAGPFSPVAGPGPRSDSASHLVGNSPRKPRLNEHRTAWRYALQRENRRSGRQLLAPLSFQGPLARTPWAGFSLVRIVGYHRHRQ